MQTDDPALVSVDPAAPGPPESRRHDLDALRAFAMLLGIVLHVSLSFFPMFWPVQDTQKTDAFGLLFLMIHGFRMPLFFLLSGYFTMMIYRKRGLAELLRQRAKRILIPCLLGLMTVVPLMKLATGWALNRSVLAAPALQEPLFDAIRSNNSQAVQDRIRQGDHPDQLDGRFKVSALSWACLTGNVDTVQVLLDAKANVNIPNGDGNTPILAAAFVGQDKIVRLLLERGANPNGPNPNGTRAIDSANAPHELTTGVLELLGLPRPDLDQLDAGRARVRELLQPLTPATENAADTAPSVVQRADTFLRPRVAAYTSFLKSDRFQIGSGTRSFHLVTTSVFDHLWFLWFLCWMVAGFAIAERLGFWSLHGPLRGNRNLWLLPATILPQLFMGAEMPVFGPDTSTGLLPMPHLLVYYAIFFAFGAAHFDAREQQQDLGNRYWLLIGSSVFLVLPLGLVMMGQRIPSAIIQPIYAWAVCFGCIGLFRRYLRSPNSKIRYLSDASYWMYLIHLPLVIGLQSLFQSLSWPALLKFALINLIAMGLLLVTYQLLVRNTVIGLLLNGRRTGGPSVPSAVTAN